MSSRCLGILSLSVTGATAGGYGTYPKSRPPITILVRERFLRMGSITSPEARKTKALVLALTQIGS